MKSKSKLKTKTMVKNQERTFLRKLLNPIYWFFELDYNKTNIRSEVTGGLITFLSMIYIFALNSMILGPAFGDRDMGVFIATSITASITTILLGITTNLPFALASSLGVNSIFALEIQNNPTITWEIALGGMFFYSVLLIFLSSATIKKFIMRAIPKIVQTSMTVMIGSYLAFLGVQFIFFDGLYNLKSDWEPWLGIIGIILSGVFLQIGFKKSAMLLSMTLITFLTWIIDARYVPDFTNYLDGFKEFGEILGKGVLAIPEAIKMPAVWIFITIVTFSNFFESTSVFLSSLDVLGKSRRDVRLHTAFSLDSVGNVAAGAFGCSPIVFCPESSVGISSGSKTGLSAVVTGLGFLTCIWAFPIFLAIPFHALGGVLIFTGGLLFSHISNIKFEKTTDYIVSFIGIIFALYWESIIQAFGMILIAYLFFELFHFNGRELEYKLLKKPIGEYRFSERVKTKWKIFKINAYKIHFVVYFLGILFICSYIWVF